MANFPTSLDTFVDPTGTQTLNNPSHSGQHALANDAIAALEAKVGINSSAVTTSLDYLVKNALSIDPGHHHTNSTLDSIASSKVTGLPTFPSGTIVGNSDSQTLTNKTLTAPVISGNITGTPKFTTPIIVSGYVNNGNSGATPTINWASGDRQILTISAACTITFSNATAGQVLTLFLYENGTGGFSITFPTIKWNPTAPSFTTTANAINSVAVFYDGTNYIGQWAANYS